MDEPLPPPARWKQDAALPIGQMIRHGACVAVGGVGALLGGVLGILPALTVKIGDELGVRNAYYTERERGRHSLFRLGNYLQFQGLGALIGSPAGPVGLALGALGGTVAARLWLELGDRFRTSYDGHFPYSGNWNTAQAIGDRGTLPGFVWAGWKEGSNLGRRSLQELFFPTRFANGWEQHDGPRPEPERARAASLKSLMVGDYRQSLTESLQGQRSSANGHLLEPLLAAVQASSGINKPQAAVLTALVNHYRANSFAYIEHFHGVLQHAPTPQEAEVLERLPALAAETDGSVSGGIIHWLRTNGSFEDTSFRRILAGGVPEPKLKLATAIVRSAWPARERSEAVYLVLNRELAGEQADALKRRVQDSHYSQLDPIRAALKDAPRLPDPAPAALPALPAPSGLTATSQPNPATPVSRGPLQGEVAPANLEYSPDGRYLAVGRPGQFEQNDGQAVPQVEYWDLSSGQRVGPDDPELKRRTADKLVRTTDRGQVFVWDAASHSVTELHGHTERISAHALSPLGGLLVTSAWDGTVRLWNTDTGHELRRLPVYLAASRLEFSDDGRQLVIGEHDGGVTFVDMTTFQPVRKLEDQAREAWGTLDQLAFSPDRKTMLVARHEETDYPRPAEWDHEVRLVEAASLKVLGKVPLPEAARAMTLSPDGRMLAVATRERVQVFNVPDQPDGLGLLAGSLQEAAFQGILKPLKTEISIPSGAWASSLCFSPDSRELAVGLSNNQVLRCETVSGDGPPVQLTAERVTLGGVVIKRRGAFRAAPAPAG